MAIYYRTKGSIMSLKTLYRRTLKRGYATEHSHKSTRKEAKRNARNILNDAVPETIFYYAINSRLENLKTIEKNAVIKNTWKNLSPGMIVEIDATPDTMGLGETFHTYHAIDPATGRLLAVHVSKEETNIGYMNLLEKLFRTHGIPQIIKTDKRTTFWKKSLHTHLLLSICDL
ncbi:hypothetical protein AB5V95_03025 [Metamycoplasma spumans]